MAYEHAWQFDANRAFTPATAADLTKLQMWYLASFLLGYVGGATGAGLWTLVGTSDGTTGSLDGTWRWGTPGTYDGTKIIQITATPATSAHSWCLLRSPQMPDGGYTLMLIDAYHTTTAGFSLFSSRVAWRLASTSTFQPVCEQFVPNSSVSGNILSNDGTTIQCNFNGALANDGQFVVFNAKLGSGFVQFGTMWAPVAGYTVGDLFPYYLARSYNSVTPGFGTFGNFSAANANANNARSGVDSTQGNNLIPLVAMAITGSQNKDQITGGVWDFPTLVFFSESGGCHARGRVRDIAIIPSATTAGYIATGSTIRDAGNVVYVTIGTFIIPFNAALIL